MSKKDNIVIKRLLARASGEKDNHKIGLIIEGGGMRGAFSGGVMVELEKLGLRDRFDYIYASSSGSCAGAYFLSGQSKIGSSIYPEELNGFKFIKPWRINRAADIDYLCDTIFRHKRKLDIDKIRKSKTILKIFVADADTGECDYYTNKDNVDLIQVIKASCALPAFYNKPVTIGPNQHMDGRIGKAIPIEDALTDGCSDVLVVTAVPESYRPENDIMFVKTLKKFLMRNLPKQYRNIYKTERQSNYKEGLDIVFGRAKIHRDINIYTISPNHYLSKFGTNRDKLEKAIIEGTRATEATFVPDKG